MQCVILAGGLGTRIRNLSGGLPKSLIPVHGKPFIFYQLEWLSRQGIRNVVLCIGYNGSMISAVVGDGASLGMSISYTDEGEVLRGTGGALRHAAELGLLASGFIVLYGDSYVPIELSQVWRTSQDGRLPTMVILKNEGKWDRSNVIYRDGELILYDKSICNFREIGMDYIDYGISVLPRDIIVRCVPNDAPSDLALLLTRLSKRRQLKAHEVFSRFYEIGTPEGLKDFEQHIREYASSESNSARTK